MVQLSLSQSTADLEGILSLQLENLSTRLSQEEKNEQGFVTIQHNLEQLQAMHAIAPHVLAKENDQVVGYVLAMTLASFVSLRSIWVKLTQAMMTRLSAVMLAVMMVVHFSKYLNHLL